MGVVKLVLQIQLYSLVATLALVFIPGLPPNMEFDSYDVEPPASLEGKYAENSILDKAELVFDGEFVGPESIAFRGDEVYTGLLGGDIIRIKNGEWQKIVQTGTKCAGEWEVAICGRPLGLRFDPAGKLLVADATKGLLKVDVDKKTVETILPRYAKIDGSEQTLNFVDDVDVSSKDGILYFTDAGQHGECDLIDLIGEPTGRLLRYDPKTKESKVLLDGLRFANGLQLSENEDFVVVSETGLGRVLKYHLKGAKKGTVEVLIDGLPGYPDNVRSNGKGGFYISLVAGRSAKSPALDRFAPLPVVRKFIVRGMDLFVKMFRLLYSLVPSDFIGRAIVYVKHFGPFGNPERFPKRVIIVEVDENGNVLGTLMTKDSQMAFISQFTKGKTYSYLGSPFTPQLWRIKNEYLR